jgi:hypothetical protein
MTGVEFIRQLRNALLKLVPNVGAEEHVRYVKLVWASHPTSGYVIHDFGSMRVSACLDLGNVSRPGLRLGLHAKPPEDEDGDGGGGGSDGEDEGDGGRGRSNAG